MVEYSEFSLNSRRRHSLVLLLVASGCLGASAAGQAFQLSFHDARSAAMGGTGVATDPRNAVLHNPALLATAYEEYDWFAILPHYQELISDPDDLESGLNNFLVAANELYDCITRNCAGLEAAQQKAAAELAKLEGQTYRERTAKLLLLGVPSTVLSGAFYLSDYEVFSAETVIDSNDYIVNSTPVSTIDYLGVNVTEMGFASALPFTSGWLGDYNLGATLKFQLIDGIGYSQSVELSELKLEEQGNTDRTSNFNLDLGVSKEVGVWKFGIAAQNLFSTSVDLGDSGQTFGLEPSMRAGVAYRSRKTYFEVDADLIKVQQFGVAEKSQFVAAGWEYSLLPWLFLRAGINHDLGGNNLSTYSYGLGLNLSGFQIDAAASSNEEEQGLYGQLTLKF